MNKVQKQKRKVRSTKEWTNFRKLMYNRCEGVDKVTGMPLRKGWQLHHLDMNSERYAELIPEKFICVNRQTHEMIHWVFRYKEWKQLLLT